MTNDIIPQQSFERHQRVMGLCKNLEKTFIQLGEELFWIENDKDYLNLGHPTFNSYLADPEVTIGRTMAFMAKEVWRVYIHQLELKSSTVELLDAGVSKLYKVKDEVNKDNVMTWVHDCAALSRTDINKKLGKGGKRSGGTNNRGKSDSSTVTLPIYTQERLENTARHAVMDSYPSAAPEVQDELVKFAAHLLEENAPSTNGIYWKRLTKMALKARRGWKRISFRQGEQIESLKAENARMFEEIIGLNARIEELTNPQSTRDKGWREKILEEY